MTDVIFRSTNPNEFASFKKQKLFYMKQLGFTIQFLVLLLAIPVLMYVEITRDDPKKQKEEVNNQREMAFNKKIERSVTGQLNYSNFLN